MCPFVFLASSHFVVIMSSNIRLDTNECTQMPVHTTFSLVKLIFVAWIFKSHRTILVMIGGTVCPRD